MKLTYDDLNNRYGEYTSTAICKCTVITKIVGGQPAGEDGIRAFARHHLGIADPQELERAVKRIQAEEIGERNITPENGEVAEKLSYGLNVVRRTERGPYIANHMIHACFKQAASRLKIFQEVLGFKGDCSEAGIVSAAGISALDGDRADRVYVRNESGDGPAQTLWENFTGSVTTPKGKMSISHDSEYLPSGSRFEFQINFLNKGKIKEDDIKDVLALMMICGLGSCRSLGCGKFRIDEADIEMTKYTRTKDAA